MPSSIPAVLDWLVANIKTLTVIAEATDAVVVSDGPADTDADVVITIGGTVEPTADSTLVTASTRGQAAVNPMDEDYIVSIDVDYVASTDSQKLMRDRVFAISDAISDLIRADRTLDGLLTARVGAEPTSVIYHQTPDEEVADRVRQALVSLGIRVRNRI